MALNAALPEDVQVQLGGFEELLSSLESKLQPFTAPGSKASLAELDPLERAQTHLALANVVHTLYQLYLKASGVDPADHESAKEQERLKQYSKKVRKVLAEKELAESRRSMEVNVAAVNRFITAAVPDLSREQKAALKQAGQQATAAGGNVGTDGGSGAAAGRKRKAGGSGAAASAEQEATEAEDAAQAFLQHTMAELQEQGANPQLQQAKGTAAAAVASPGNSKAKQKRQGRR